MVAGHAAHPVGREHLVGVEHPPQHPLQGFLVHDRQQAPVAHPGTRVWAMNAASVGPVLLEPLGAFDEVRQLRGQVRGGGS